MGIVRAFAARVRDEFLLGIAERDVRRPAVGGLRLRNRLAGAFAAVRGLRSVRRFVLAGRYGFILGGGRIDRRLTGERGDHRRLRLFGGRSRGLGLARGRGLDRQRHRQRAVRHDEGGGGRLGGDDGGGRIGHWLGRGGVFRLGLSLRLISRVRLAGLGGLVSLVSLVSFAGLGQPLAVGRLGVVGAFARLGLGRRPALRAVRGALVLGGGGRIRRVVVDHALERRLRALIGLRRPGGLRLRRLDGIRLGGGRDVRHFEPPDNRRSICNRQASRVADIFSSYFNCL